MSDPSLPPQSDLPQQVAAASIAWGKLRRMAAYANFDGWSLVILGALNLICCSGYGSVTGLMISIAMLGTGMFELSSVRKLRRLNPTAISRLVCNQLILAAVLILYCIVSLVQNQHSSGASPDLDQLLSQLGASAADVRDQLPSLWTILYASVIALTLIIQGGTARYYWSRRKHLSRYIEQTPDWIQQMQRERGEVSF
jgi:hypothetical protein